MNRPSRPDPSSSPEGSPLAVQRARCPRCGAGLGRLEAAAADVGAPDAGAWYCGCCGLVVPDAGASAAPR